MASEGFLSTTVHQVIDLWNKIHGDIDLETKQLGLVDIGTIIKNINDL